MQSSKSSVILPPIRCIFDDVARYEATHQDSLQHQFPNFIHMPTNRTLPPPVSNVYSHPTSLQSPCRTPPRLPSYSQSTYPPAQLRDSYLQVPHTHPRQPEFCDTVKSRRDQSNNAFRALMASTSNIPETEGLFSGSYITPPVTLPHRAKGPQLEHPPPQIAEGVAPPVFKDVFRARAMDFPSEQVFWVPSVPPRPIVESSIEHGGLLHCRLAHNPPHSPSISLSPSIEGSPRMTLPFPLIPATPPASRLQESLQEPQIMSSQNAGENNTSDEAPGPARHPVKLTKNGKPYTRDRQPELTQPPNQPPLSRTVWAQWEKDAALEAIDWYEQRNPAFVLSRSTNRERKRVLPAIYNHIIRVIMPTRWRRTYDGFLTWTARARKRPTLRRPAECDGTAAMESVKGGKAGKAAAGNPQLSTETGPIIAA